MTLTHLRTVTITAALALSTLSLSTLVAAQAGQPGGRQLTPEMRARIAQMQPITDLAQTIRLLPELEKNRATAMTRAQAKSLLTILTALQKASAVQPADAKKYLTQIEDRVLTEPQLSALDTLVIRAEEARAAQRQAGGQTGPARIPGLPGGLIPGGQRPGGPAGQGQPGQGGQNVQPGQFNPFKQGRGAELLKAYMALLQKK